MKPIGFLCLLSFISVARANENACQLNTAEEGIIQFTEYPTPPGDECLIYTGTVTVEGYNVDVIFEFLELDTANGDYLIISPGPSLVKDEASIILTGIMKTKRKLRVIDSGQIFVMLVTQKRDTAGDTSYKGFKFSYSAFGDLTTDSPTTSPRPILPTPPTNVDYDATVYVDGKSLEKFLNYTATFKEAVVRMASNFCNDENIKLQKEPTSDNVVFHQITQCPRTWPGWEKCTQIRMRVALYVTSQNYQLTRKNILKMWNRYANIELEPPLKIYEAPNDEDTLKLWLYITVGVAVVFTIVLVVAWQLNLFSQKKKATANSHDQFGKLSTASTASWMSNSDATYQELPPIFDYIYDQTPSQDLSPEKPPSNTLTNPEVEHSRPSEGFQAGLLFGSLTGRGAYENPCIDMSSEEQQHEQANKDDFNSNKEDTTKDTKQNQDHLYEDPQEDDSEDDKNESIL